MHPGGAVEGQTIQLNGMDMYVESEGRGEPLLLLHGMGGSSADWGHAGRRELAQHYRLIIPDARGHGRSTNPEQTFSMRQCALDTLALMGRLGIRRCRAIGSSLGGNVLLHMATLDPERLEAMVLVSAALYFPEPARALMRAVPVESQPPEAWQLMRQRHPQGDEQIVFLWRAQRALADSFDDMTFTPPSLARIRADTLVVYGDRDPLYPVEMALEMFRAIPRSALWVVPTGGHGPIYLEAAPLFTKTALEFLARSRGAQV